jgi:hypothetical protein
MSNSRLQLDWITQDVLDRVIGRQCDSGDDQDRAAFAAKASRSPEFYEYVQMMAYQLAEKSAQEVIAVALSIGIEIGLMLANEQPQEEDAA